MFDLIVILIPLFPLLAVLANGLNVMLGHRYSDEIAHRLGWGSVLLSFLCALWVFGQTLGHPEPRTVIDRKSTRLNSSHSQISYAVFCLKKKKNTPHLLEYAPRTIIV